MDRLFKEFLFTKGVLVSEVGGRIEKPLTPDVLEQQCGIVLPQGTPPIHPKLLAWIQGQLGKDVPSGFYQQFPASVKQMSPELLQYEQTCHYLEQDASLALQLPTPEHSMLERKEERMAFEEDTPRKHFVVLSEKEAKDKLGHIIEDMLKSPKPLTELQYKVLLTYVTTYDYIIDCCACKNTAIRLLVDTRDLAYGRFLKLSDVIEVANLLSSRHETYPKKKNIQLPCKDRKLVTRLIDQLMKIATWDAEICYGKKKEWCGLLHHIHYKTYNPMSETFVKGIRSDENLSVYSDVEFYLSEDNWEKALNCLYESKGSDGVLQALLRLVGYCRYEKDVAVVLKSIQEGSAIQLIKTYVALCQFDPEATLGQVSFNQHGRQVYHTRKASTPKYPITQKRLDKMKEAVQKALQRKLSRRLGRVYIAPEMYHVALPLFDTVGTSGYGVLPQGSSVILPCYKKIRFFTHWQGNHDVDLSVIGLDEAGEQVEFSWRTMHKSQSDAIAYSGDALGGEVRRAEYVDIDMEVFAYQYPHIKQLIVCQNMFSGKYFDRCPTRTGYMLRDRIDTGNTFEIKTVQTVFDVACKSTFVQLFALDLQAQSLIWLGAPQAFEARIADRANISLAKHHLNATQYVNMGWLFERMATQVMTDPQEAQVVVGDNLANVHSLAEQIRTCDTERVLALLV